MNICDRQTDTVICSESEMCVMTLEYLSYRYLVFLQIKAELMLFFWSLVFFLNSK